MLSKKITTILLSALLTFGTLPFSQRVNAAIYNGWELKESTWYYYVGGSKAIGWLYWNTNWYYLNPNGDMAKNQWITWNGKQYYLNSMGDMAINTAIDGWKVGADGAWDGKERIATINKAYVNNPELQIDLKIRSAPNLESSVLGYLYNFQNIQVLDKISDDNKNVWDKIGYNNNVAYVSDAYIQHYISPSENVVTIAKNITKQFETGNSDQIAGNFDGEGLSLGYLQWCIKQRTLQPLLHRMDREFNSELRVIFGTNYEALHNMLLDTPENQVKWAYSINTSENSIIEPWYSQFVTLCNNEHFKTIENDAVSYTVKQAMIICDKYNLKTVRGFALAFDIVTQNGSISSNASNIIQAALMENPDISEKNLLNIIAGAVSQTEDIRSRKIAIVKGQGLVHGSFLNLDANYELSDNSWR